jgi:hypothetical protein
MNYILLRQNNHDAFFRLKYEKMWGFFQNKKNTPKKRWNNLDDHVIIKLKTKYHHGGDKIKINQLVQQVELLIQFGLLIQ